MGSSASRVLPTIWVQRWSVWRVSAHCAYGSAGQVSVGCVDIPGPPLQRRDTTRAHHLARGAGRGSPRRSRASPGAPLYCPRSPRSAASCRDCRRRVSLLHLLHLDALGGRLGGGVGDGAGAERLGLDARQRAAAVAPVALRVIEGLVGGRQRLLPRRGTTPPRPA